VLLNKRIEVNDHEAFYEMGSMYFEGYNIAQDKSKALEYYIRGAELGSTMSLYSVAYAFDMG
jgi:TPR repeat protein